jgi:hypothetical protein
MNDNNDKKAFNNIKFKSIKFTIDEGANNIKLVLPPS